MGLLNGLLLSGDNAPLYRGLIESGYGLDWTSSGVHGIDRDARTTTMHIGVQGVRAEQAHEFPARVHDILSQVVKYVVLPQFIGLCTRGGYLSFKKDSSNPPPRLSLRDEDVDEQPTLLVC